MYKRQIPDQSTDLNLLDLPDDVAEKLRDFFCEWLRMKSPARDCVAMRLLGGSHVDIGAIRGVSKQAIHKTVKAAMSQCPTIAIALGKTQEAA